jgi:hypothetical protein
MGDQVRWSCDGWVRDGAETKAVVVTVEQLFSFLMDVPMLLCAGVRGWCCEVRNGAGAGNGFDRD